MDRRAGIVFRKASLENLNSPERLDELVTVTNPRLWIMLVGTLLVAATMAAWFFFGTVSIVIHGQGIFLSQDGLVRVTVPQAGTLRDLRVQPGEEVQLGQVLATLSSGNLTPIPILSPKAGRVVEWMTSSGTPLDAQAHVLTLAPDGQELKAFVLVPFPEGSRLRPSMQVQLVPASMSTRNSGHLMGTVEEVAELPASPNALLNLLQNPRLVDLLSSKGEATRLVRVRLLPDSNSPGSYRGSSRYPSQRIRPGTLCGAGFVVRKVRPFDLGFGSAGHGQ